MVGFLEALARHGTKILIGGLLIGLVWPDLAAAFRPAVAPCIFVMLTIVMMRVDIAAVWAQLRRPWLLLAAQGWAMVALPLLLIASLAFWTPDPGLLLALIFWTSAAPLSSSPALSMLVGLDGAVSLGFLIAGVALYPLTTPIFTEIVAGDAIAISGFELAIRLIALIAGAALAGWLGRRLLGPERRARHLGTMDGLNIITLVIFAIGLMDGITAELLADPLHMMSLMALAFGLSLVANALTLALFWRFGRRHAATFGFSNGARNIAIVIGALGGQVPHETWLFFVSTQFPIYFLPMLLKPVYRRLVPDPAPVTYGTRRSASRQSAR